MAAYEHTFKDKQEHTLTVSEYFSIAPPSEVTSNEGVIYPDGSTTDFNTLNIASSFENVLQADYNNIVSNLHSPKEKVNRNSAKATINQIYCIGFGRERQGMYRERTGTILQPCLL